MVAAAGPTEGFTPRIGGTLLVSIALCLAIILALSTKVQLLNRLPLAAPPEELAIRAKDIVRTLGYNESPGNVASGFDFDPAHLQSVAQTIAGTRSERRNRWNHVFDAGPWPLTFIYIQSPAPLLQDVDIFPRALPANHDASDPGSASVQLDLKGRLLRFQAWPSRAEWDTLAGVASHPTDWNSLFMAAGLDRGRFVPTESHPQMLPADSWVAWSGAYPEGGTPVRIDASSFRGRVTSFTLQFPWGRPQRLLSALTPEMATTLDRSGNTKVDVTNALTLRIAFVVLAVVAWRNWKQRRVDFRGAWRFAAILFFVNVVGYNMLTLRGWLSLFEWSPAVFWAVQLWIGYLAIEPWVRRVWPHVMITWSRILAGRWHDPLVGRDLLIAVAAVTADYALQYGIRFIAVQAGSGPWAPPDLLDGNRLIIARVLAAIANGVGFSIFLFVVPLVAMALFRRRWAAALALIVVWGVAYGGSSISQGDTTWTIRWALEVTFIAALTLRVGIFATGIFSGLSMLINQSVLTSNLTAWQGQSTLTTVIVIATLALFAFRVSLGDRATARASVVRAA